MPSSFIRNMKMILKMSALASLFVIAGCKYESLESQAQPASKASVVPPASAPASQSSTSSDSGTSSASTPSSSTSAAFNPRSLSGVRFHYEAENISTSGWTDTTGNYSSQTLRGALTVVTSDGFRALSFDGSIDGGSSLCKGIETGDAFAGLDGTTVSFSIFIVAKPSYDANGTNDIFGVPNLSFGLDYPSGSTNSNRLNYGDNSSLTTATGSETFTNAYQVFEWSMSNGAVSHMGRNASDLTLAGTISGVTISDNSVNSKATIGGNGVQSCFIGRIAEIVMYNRALSATERAKVTTYLRNKFGI